MSSTALQQDTTVTRLTDTSRTADHAAAVESWRVVTEATGDAAATADAIVRLRSGSDRQLLTGEGHSSEAALLDALETAQKITPGSRLELGRSLRAYLEAREPEANVALEAVHQQGLIARLVVLLNAHHVTSFSYRVDPDQELALVELSGRDSLIWPRCDGLIWPHLRHAGSVL
jgi:hypothetical protein